MAAIVTLLALVGYAQFSTALAPQTTANEQLSLGGEPAVATATLTGRASVIDGDTIEIHGVRIRLYGIDAPESSQTCTAKGQAYRCGQQAALALANKIGNRPVSCQAKDQDRYGRTVAVCFVAGEDINARIVKSGWALAYRRYSEQYVAQESHAAQAKLGLWQGEFTPPWQWRRAHAQNR